MKRMILSLLFAVGILTSNGCGIPCVSATARMRARQAMEINRVRQVALVCLLYADEHNQMLPSSLEDLNQYFNESFDSSGLELVAKGKLSQIAAPGTAVMVRSNNVFPDGNHVVAYVDGHGEIVQK